MLLSENYALSPKLCYLHFTLILRKIKIISRLTLSILTLMNIHIVHLPVSRDESSRYGTGSAWSGGTGCTRGRRHLWSEAWGRRVISVVAWVSVLCTEWPLPSAGPYLTCWPWALAETSIFSKSNTKIKYKLNYSRAMMFFFCFQHIKARIMPAVLTWNKSLIKIMLVLLNYA